MNAYILASGRTKTEYFKSFDNPKCLFLLDDETTILDFQIGKFRKFGLNPVVIMGYKMIEIVKHLNSYPDIDTIIDLGWANEYTITRVLQDHRDKFELPCIISFSDIVFQDRVLEGLLHSKYDLTVDKTRSIIKTNSKAFNMMLHLIDTVPKYKGWENALWRDLRENGIVVEYLNPYFIVQDIDRDEVTTRIRKIYKYVR